MVLGRLSRTSPSSVRTDMRGPRARRQGDRLPGPQRGVRLAVTEAAKLSVPS